VLDGTKGSRDLEKGSKLAVKIYWEEIASHLPMFKPSIYNGHDGCALEVQQLSWGSWPKPPREYYEEAKVSAETARKGAQAVILYCRNVFFWVYT
jgi:hypothetical protein